MSKSLKYLADDLVISPGCNRRQLNLSQPDAASFREWDIILASMCDLNKKCEVSRLDPSVHVLIFSLEGYAKLFTDNTPRKGQRIEPGQVVILPAHHPHYYELDGPNWKAIWFYLADTDVWRHLRDSRPHVRVSLTGDELRIAMEGFWLESLRNETRARLAAHHYAELVLLNLERELDMEESPSNKEMRQRLYKLWDSVSANLGDNWTVAKLADEMNISPQHLYRVSLRLCGHKPMEVVTMLRMKQAQEFLISTNYMIKAIARLLGYANAFSFSVAFKKYAGCCPRDFRRKNQKRHKEPEKFRWNYHKAHSEKVKK